jgi:peptide/nickel transport system permease protein
MLSEGQRYLTTAYWLVAAPGVAMLLVSIGFNLLGDGLRDILDPTAATK